MCVCVCVSSSYCMCISEYACVCVHMCRCLCVHVCEQSSSVSHPGVNLGFLSERRLAPVASLHHITSPPPPTQQHRENGRERKTLQTKTRRKKTSKRACESYLNCWDMSSLLTPGRTVNTVQFGGGGSVVNIHPCVSWVWGCTLTNTM